MGVDNKVILVSGAAGLLGYALVEKLLQESACVVAIDQYIQKLEILKSQYQNLHLVEADSSNPTVISSALAEGETRFGKVNGGVNCAYPRNSDYGKPLFEVTANSFCDNVSLHLGNCFVFMQQCALYSINKESEFSLVNLSSIYGNIAPKFEVYEGTSMTMPVEYAAIKAASQQLVSYFSAYCKTGGFRINSVSPGGILNGQPAAFLQRYKEHCRSKGMLDTDDILPSILFLLSDESASLVNQNIIVDDGFSV